MNSIINAVIIQQITKGLTVLSPGQCLYPNIPGESWEELDPPVPQMKTPFSPVVYLVTFFTHLVIIFGSLFERSPIYLQ